MTNPTQFVFRLGLLVSLLTLAGCQTRFNNFTPERIPQNPSGLYTFSFGAELIATNVVEGSERAMITINGDTFEMERSPTGERIFSFDYAMPGGVNEARYFYTLTYDFLSKGVPGSSSYFSTDDEGGVYVSRLINRYPIQLVADRGPVGANIDLVGNGFAPGDMVIVGGVQASTTVNDANSIDFAIPFLAPGQSYEVALRTAQGDIAVGLLRVDAGPGSNNVTPMGGTMGGATPGPVMGGSSAVVGSFNVVPDRLDLFEGENSLLIIEIGSPAPPGGLYIDVTTDIPESIIMDEVVIPAGSPSVSVTIEGGIPGAGNLFINVPGQPERVVPVVVQ